MHEMPEILPRTGWKNGLQPAHLSRDVQRPHAQPRRHLAADRPDRARWAGRRGRGWDPADRCTTAAKSGHFTTVAMRPVRRSHSRSRSRERRSRSAPPPRRSRRVASRSNSAAPGTAPGPAAEASPRRADFVTEDFTARRVATEARALPPRSSRRVRVDGGSRLLGAEGSPPQRDWVRSSPPQGAEGSPVGTERLGGRYCAATEG